MGEKYGLFSALGLVGVWVWDWVGVVFGFGLVKSLTFFMNVITFVGNILSAFVCVCLSVNESVFFCLCVCVCCVVIQSAINHAYAVRAVCLLDLMSMRLLFSVWFFSLSFFVLFLSFVRSRLFCTLKPL